MSDMAIRVDGLSKRYRLGQREPYKTLRDALTRGFTAPFRHLRSTFQRANGPRANGKHLWALKDVSFEVKQGEVVGIIGRIGYARQALLQRDVRVSSFCCGYPPEAGDSAGRSVGGGDVALYNCESERRRAARCF